MRILEDWKCSLTTALLTVLVFLFLSQLLEVRGDAVMESTREGEFFNNSELVLILSVFIGYLLNVTLFKDCAPARR
jgi:hypothetical protein